MEWRVLIVDNAEYARERLKKLLEEHGCRVVAGASNSTEAIAAYEKYHPDFVTLDLVLPEEHGFQILEKLRSVDPQAKAIIVSAMVDQDTVERASLAGAIGYVTKPETWAQFEKILAKIA